jgi:glutamate N-acetyltransferase/amino-acid N-acetyltransferase
VRAAPVAVSIDRLRRGRAQAIVVNSGNANAYTGKNGLAAAHAMCRVVARELRVPADLVVPSSTGRIGVPLPWRNVRDGAMEAARAVADDGFHRALEAMMTTDAFPKFAAERIRVGGRTITVAGMAKGAGMIAPNMTVVGPAHATLLSYVLTDARVRLTALRRVVREALPHSFNSIVVDGDTSTNDTLLVLANGVAGNSAVTAGSRDFGRFAAVVTEILRVLSRMIVKDGEGATKVVDIVVRRARTVADAARDADTIARTPLCKAAFYG